MDTPLRGGRLRRSAGPARVAARGAWRWGWAYLRPGGDRAERKRQAVLRTSEDVTRTLGEMKGAAMKLGQVLSMMSGAVPDEMTGALSTLHSSAPPMAWELTTQVIREELGDAPERIFKHFEHKPFAAASIGQVHRATLMDGREVAVKVQYPGVGHAIESDLANVTAMVGLAGMVSSGLDAQAIARELRAGISAELDYLAEAAWQRRFSEIFDGHPSIFVPKVIDELTTARVLVQEFVRGKPFRHALDLPQEERNRVAEIVYRFAFGSLYQFRLFNGDPHPGNYLLMDDGRVAFLDYGCVAEFSEDVVLGFKRIVGALIRDDRQEWRRAVEAIGILKEGAPFTLEQLYEHMHWYWAPILAERVTFTPELTGEMIRRNTQTAGLGGQINRWCNVPEGMVFLTRINFGLAGVFASLRAEGPWRGIIEEYVDGIDPVTEVGRASRLAAGERPAV